MSRGVKRAIDVTLAATGLLVALPLMLGVAVAVLVAMGRPVLFRQLRPGYLGRPFEVVKFRTMNNARGPDGRLLDTGERTTRIGYLLRRTSLDELPELWNVLRGDMSLVGPRPLLMEYLPRYTPEQARRHEVRPGITGLAQVRGRHLLEWQDRFDLDIWYVDHWSLRLDFDIMRATIKLVVLGSGLPPRGTPDYVFRGTNADGGGAVGSAPPDEAAPVGETGAD